MKIQRCGWCSNDPLYIAYHDEEWGKPEHDEARLFEMLCLEGQQAGLSWITVLKKEKATASTFLITLLLTLPHLQMTFLEKKLSDAGLIRHLGKLKAIRDNAIAWQALKAQVGDVPAWLWQFVDATPQHNDVIDYRKAPAQTELSVKLSKTLKKMVSNLLVQPPAMRLCRQ